MKIKSKFYKVYIICVCVFAALLLAGLTLEFFWLREYELSQPLGAAAAQVKKYTDATHSAQLLASGDLNVSTYETAENLSKIIAEAGDGLQIVMATKSIDCDAAYAVKKGDTRIMTVFLKRNEEKYALGNRGYSVFAAALSEDYYKTVELSFPSDAKITLNGKILADEDKKGGAAINLGDKSVDNSALVTRQTAKIERLLATPVIEAYFGEEKGEVIVEGDKITVSRAIPQAEKQAMEYYALEGMKQYSRFMQNEVEFSAVSPFLKSGTDFYSNVRNSLVKWAKEHEPLSFEEVYTGEVFRHSENIYSCRVSFIQHMVNKTGDYVSKVDKTVYLQASGGSYKIIDAQNVA